MRQCRPCGYKIECKKVTSGVKRATVNTSRSRALNICPTSGPSVKWGVTQGFPFPVERTIQLLFSVYYWNTYYFRSNKSSCLTVSFLFTVRVHSYSHIRIHHGISMIFMNAACLVPSYRNAVQSQFWLNSVSASSALTFKYAFLFLSAFVTPLAHFQSHTSQERRPHGRVQNVLLRHSFHNNFWLVLLVGKQILN